MTAETTLSEVRRPATALAPNIPLAEPLLHKRTHFPTRFQPIEPVPIPAGAPESRIHPHRTQTADFRTNPFSEAPLQHLRFRLMAFLDELSAIAKLLPLTAGRSRFEQTCDQN